MTFPATFPATLPAFTRPGRFYRGNLHCHSTRSDGALSPEEVCRRYKAQGYDFISLTDHFVGLYDYPITDTRAFQDNAFTTIPGAELHSGAMENGELWHILAVGLPADFAASNSPGFAPVADQETGPELARRARAAGAFVTIAHPHWSGLSQADARSIDAAHAVEIYNHASAVGCDRGEGMACADLLLSEGRHLTLVATDDAHFHGPDAFGGWVMVKAETLCPEALLDALKAGAFYSSQGPEFHDIRLNDDTLQVSCSAVQAIVVQGQGCTTSGSYGDSQTSAQLSLFGMAQSPWLRVTIIDRSGKRAWSPPFANPMQAITPKN